MLQIDISQWVTGLVIIAMVVALFRDLMKPVVVFGAAICVLLLFNVVDAKQALNGFSNENVAVIILLLVISSIIKKAGLIEIGLNRLFKGANTYKRFSFRMVAFVSGVSGFLNNTPIVATFIPYVFTWAKKNKIAPSKLLIPLSYAAIMGGMLTLIGTSTNLIVNGLAKEYGFRGFGIFDFAFVGLPIVIIGGAYILLLGNRWLPNLSDPLEGYDLESREFLVETHVRADSILVDKTVQAAELRNLKGLFLVEIIRGKRQIGPVKPSQNIRAHDTLIFVGDTETLPELISSNLGLELPKLRDIPSQEHIEMMEAVITPNSPLAGKKVRSTDFRGVYDAAIVGVHRNGERLQGKIGDVELQAGDLLVVMAGRDFRKRVDGKAFYLLSKIRNIDNQPKTKSWILTGGALLAILLSAIGVVSLFKGLLIFIVLSILFNFIKPQEIQRSIDLNLAVIAALSIGVGHAMTESGLAAEIAGIIQWIAGSGGTLALIITLYLVTNLLTEFITNVAAASITLPIAINVAQNMGVDIEPYVFTVAFAASASFLTPIGYQTNLMVLGPGGYKFKHYFMFGLPLSIICLLIVITILGLRYQLF